MTIAGAPLARPTELVKLLQIGLASKPDDAALVSLERTWSWAELEAASNNLARQYLAMGLAPGDRVASLMPNRGVLLVHYLACLKAGLVATPLNYRYQAPEIDHALEVSGAALLVAHRERSETLAACDAVTRLSLGVVTCGEALPGKRSLESLLAETCPPLEHPQPRPSDPAFIFFTSGSTGKPKGVTHSHETFGWIVASAVAGLGITANDVFLPATSASHVAACSFSFAGLAAGGRVAIARAFTSDELLPLLRASRPSLLCMLPAPLWNLVRDHGAAKSDFRSIRKCVSGGDKLSAELEREFTALTSLEIEELYGMTEMGTATYSPSGERNRPGSIGQVAPGFEASIRDEDGREAPLGAPGRLWIKSPTTMTGYWNRPDATAEAIVDGWLDTGDIVSVDERNYLWFRGRKKQIIIHDGSNICPQEVEEALLENTAIAGAGVVGIHDLVHGENVRAYVVFKSESERPTAAQLIQFARARVGYKAPEEIVVLDELPMNAVGKVDRAALKQMAEAGANRRPM